MWGNDVSLMPFHRFQLKLTSVRSEQIHTQTKCVIWEALISTVCVICFRSSQSQTYESTEVSSHSQTHSCGVLNSETLSSFTDQLHFGTMPHSGCICLLLWINIRKTVLLSKEIFQMSWCDTLWIKHVGNTLCSSSLIALRLCSWVVG